MLKKSLVLMSISAAFFAQAQDISVIRNSVEIYSNSPNIGSSKFNAMAGSNGALGGDASSLLTNPAGLGVAISGDVSGTLSINSNKNTSSLAGSSVKYTVNKTDLGNAGGVVAIPLMSKTGWKFINIGVNYSNQSIENYVESPGNGNIIIPKKLVDQNTGNDVNGNLSYLGHNYDRYGNQSKMNIGVGANYENRLYLGAGLNFHYASIDQRETARFGLDLDNSVDSFTKQYTPNSERSNGFSASIGVISKLSNEFRVGASIETPTWWTIDRAFSEYYTGEDGSIYYKNFGEDRTFTSPMKATVSAAFVPSKNFSLNVDYTLGLTKPKYKVQGEAESELNSFFSDKYKNLSEVRVGAEYRIKSFRLRGGYSYASSPFDAFTISAYSNAGAATNTNYSDLILGSRNTIGAGIGYDFGQFYLDAAYQNISSNYKNPFLQSNADYGTGYYSGNFDVSPTSSAVSEVKNNRSNFFITFGWKF